MSQPGGDKLFAGSIPHFYESCLVPLIFEPYAADLAQRLKEERPARVLETAAGTGVVTRALAGALAPDTRIVATDLNQPMLDYAASVRGLANVEWRQADAMALPFEDDSFDAVVCQFGVMFFPDRAHAFAEVRRVLRDGGTWLFNVWDSIESNEFAHVVTESLATLFPHDPPRFLARTPHGYSDRKQIEADLRAAGFSASPGVTTLSARSIADHPSAPAIAYCQGTPLRNEIEQRDATLLEKATTVATEAVRQRFGDGPVDGLIQAHVVSVRA